jgi:hypothetical protein
MQPKFFCCMHLMIPDRMAMGGDDFVSFNVFNIITTLEVNF